MATNLSSAPLHVSVDALMDISAALARLDGKLEQLGAAQEAMGGDIAALKRDVRHLMDWKQRVWGMVLVLGLLPPAAAYAWALLGRQLVP